jgi:transposase
VTNVKLTPDQWKKILNFLRSRNDIYIGKPTDCKRFINAIFYMTRSGIQWRLLPRKYGEWNSVFKRFDRWAEKQIWQDMFDHFAQDADMESVMMDATVVRAHSAAGVKGGIKRRKRSDGAREGLAPKSMQ